MSKTKLVITLFIAVFSIMFLIGSTYAQDAEENLETTETTSEETVATEESTRGGLPEQVFLIYVHEDCAHCKQVEAFVDQNKIEGQVKYVQLKNKSANMAALEEEWDRFNVPRNDQGWPFMVYLDENEVETYAVGDVPVINVLSRYNDIPYVDTVIPKGDTTIDNASTSTSGGDSIFLILGGLVLAFIAGYGIFSAVSKK